MKPFGAFAFRDSVIFIVTLLFWQNLSDTYLFHGIAGLLAGLCAFLFHEWGHLLGAYLSKAVVHPAPSLFSPLLFDLDSQKNNRGQFLYVSGTGFIATSLFLFVFCSLLPLDLFAGKLAIYIGLGLAALTVFIEFPIAWIVYRRHKIPRVEIFR